MGMSWCKCPFIGMPWCECPLWVYRECECSLIGIPWYECFDANTIYSKIPFIFKTRLPQCLKPRYFQTQFIIPKKSSSFLLKASKKNWWSLLEIFEWGIDLGSDDLAQKIYFHNFIGQKGWHISKAFFFGKMNSLKIKHLKKIHFFSFWIR